MESRTRNLPSLGIMRTAPSKSQKPAPEMNKDDCSYDNDNSVAKMLAVKIIMKKRQEQAQTRGLSEDELRQQVMKEMSGDVNKKMDKMIEGIKRYR